MSQILSAKVSPKSCEKLQLLLLTNSNNLQIELAAVVDAGEPFVKATYKLEGDGPLALECYEILGVVKAAIQVNHLPNTTAIAKKIASTGQTEQFWMDYAKRCTQPAFDYFPSKFDVDLLPAVNAFKSARLFQPSKLSNLKPDALSVESLRSFPFLDSDDTISQLKSELPVYLALAEDVSQEVKPLVWWKQNCQKLPAWALACKKYYCVSHFLLLWKESFHCCNFSLISNSLVLKII